MSEETKNVTLYQQKDQEGNPVAPLVPERGIYDENGVRLDDKLKIVNLKRVDDAIASGVDTLKKEGDTQVAEVQKQLPTLKHQIGLDKYMKFNNSTNYKVGDVVLREDHLYKYKVDHKPGAWNYQEVYEVSMEQDLEEKIKEVDRNKFDKEDVVQESGKAENKVMSQKVVSDKLTSLSDKVCDFDCGECKNLTEAIIKVPQLEQKGGLRIRFTNNGKVISYNLISSSWSTNIVDWKKVEIDVISGVGIWRDGNNNPIINDANSAEIGKVYYLNKIGYVANMPDGTSSQGILVTMAWSNSAKFGIMQLVVDPIKNQLHWRNNWGKWGSWNSVETTIATYIAKCITANSTYITATNHPFTNADDVPSNSVYSIVASNVVSNLPLNGQGILFTLNGATNYKTTILQLCMNPNGKVFYRSKWGESSYSSWNPINKKSRIITVGRNKNKDYTKITDAINEGLKYKDSILILDSIEFDLISELGEDYFNQNFNGSVNSRGIELYNNIHIIGTGNSVITCNYKGDNESTLRYFSPFNINGSVTLENLQINCRRTRYCVHDEIGNRTDAYTVKYINCSMYIDNRENTIFNSMVCVGGGLGKEGYIIMENCTFECELTVPELIPYGVVSYHNDGYSDTAKSLLIIKNNYFATTFRLSWHGPSKYKTKCIFTGNISKLEHVERAESSSSTIVNTEVHAWNNSIIGDMNLHELNKKIFDLDSKQLDIVSGNLLDKSKLTMNKFIKDKTGSLSDSDEFAVSDYIEVKEGTPIYFSNVGGNQYVLMYDVDKNIIGNTNTNAINGKILTCKYVRFNIVLAYLNNIFVSYNNTDNTYNLPFGKNKIKKENIIGIKSNIDITLGDTYTTLKDIIDYANSIADDDTVVNILIPAGTYNAFDGIDLTSANSNFIGLIINSNVNLIGMGTPYDTIITASLPVDISAYSFNRGNVSTLNMWRNNSIKNLTVVGENMRYAVRNDKVSDNYIEYATETFENCIFIGKQTDESVNIDSSFGSGMCKNADIKFDRCKFIIDSVSAESSGVTFATNFHNVKDELSSIKWTFNNCKFVSGYKGFAMLLTNYSGVKNASLVFNGCKFDKRIVLQSQTGSTNSDYKFFGSNNIFSDNRVFYCNGVILTDEDKEMLLIID